jgi:hypothetical protein
MAKDDDEASGAAPKAKSQKERAREMRRDAYQKAKARRDADPRFIAMKEAAKEQRRAAQKKVRDQRKAREAEARSAEKAGRSRAMDHERVASEARAKLMTLRSEANAVQSADDFETRRSNESTKRDLESAEVALELDSGSVTRWLVKGSNAVN